NALVAGITSLGVDVLVIGPLPTPGVAYITRSLRADAGIVLSASHNPYEDNGIKFFRHDGYKLDDQVEEQIEQLVFTGKINDIRRLVKLADADIGITHDGDADRVLLCDENGEIVDGDEILAIAALDLLNSNQLRDNTLVATVMSNFGLEETLAANDGKVIRTKVGDRYVT